MSQNKSTDSAPSTPVAFFLSVIFRSVGVAFAYSVYKFGPTQSYEANLNRLPDDAGFIYAAVFLIGFTTQILGLNVLTQRHKSKVWSPDQHVYHVEKTNDVVTIINDDSHVGALNRAQRAFFNWGEYLPSILAQTFLAGFVFPFPTFAIIVLFFVSRLLYTLSYTKKAEARGNGFILFLVGNALLDGLVLFTTAKLFLR